MLYLFLGPDEYSKRLYYSDLAKQKRADLVVLDAEAGMNSQQFLETDLFSKPKVFIVPQVLAADPAKLITSPNHIVISATALDKRKKENKELLANKDVVVKEFWLPHGKELDEWITKRAGELGGKISQEAARELGARLGRDQAKEVKVGGKVVSVTEIYSLDQADSEIQKLVAYAQGREIGRADVTALVSENGEVDALQITNAIADKRQAQAFALINQFLREQTAGDEKGAIIQLNALLSEQFRNVAMIQDFTARKIPEDQILDITGWKSGRLFVIKKIAARFESKKISELLAKLSALDEELKSSAVPPRVLLDLILAQLF